MIGISVSRDVLKSLALQINSQLSASQLVCINAAANIMILTWLLWRLSTQLGVHSKDIIEGFGLTRVKLSANFFVMSLAHLLGFVALLVAQKYTGRWIFSLDNYWREDMFDHQQVSDMLILSPVREEILFRGIMFVVFFRRFGGGPLPNRIMAASGGSFVFGAIHLLNLFGSKYSPSYIALQVGLGTLIGFFYGLRFLATGSLCETLLLHMVNNLTSSFVPARTEFNLADPMIAFPLLQTVMVYSAATYFTFQSLQHQTSSSSDAAAAAAVDPLGEFVRKLFPHSAAQQQPPQQQLQEEQGAVGGAKPCVPAAESKKSKSGKSKKAD